MLLLFFVLFFIAANADYCAGGPTSTSYEEIASFSLTGYQSSIVDNDGCPGNLGVSDKTLFSAHLLKGTPFSMTITHGECTTCTDSSCLPNLRTSAWIDWDGNQVFDEVERLFWTDPGEITNSNPTITRALTIPATASTITTRLRVQAQWQSTTNLPCDSYTYGDTKDYTVIVEEPIVVSFDPVNLPFVFPHIEFTAQFLADVIGNGVNATLRSNSIVGDIVTLPITSNPSSFVSDAIPAGTYSFYLYCTGNSNHSSQNGPSQTVTVGKAPPSIVVYPNLPFVYPTASFVISITTLGNIAPTGLVKLWNDNNLLTSDTLSSNGNVTLTTNSLTTTGSFNFNVEYVGDSNYASSTTNPSAYNVLKETPTYTITNQGTVFPSITFTVTILTSSSFAAKPTGTVSLYSTVDIGSGLVVGSGSLDADGKVSISNILLSGNYTLYGNYSGDTNFNHIEFDEFQLTVQRATPSIVITTDSSPLTSGGNFSVTISTLGSIDPTGTVSLSSSVNGILGTTSLTSGSAKFTTGDLTKGAHDFTLSYGGDRNYDQGSNTLSLNVATVTSTLTITTTPSTGFTYPQGIFDISITCGPFTPTGTVSLQSTVDGAIDTQQINSGSVRFNETQLSVGDNTVFSLTYSGNANCSGITVSKTQSVLQVVPTYSITQTGTVFPSINFTITINRPNFASYPSGTISLSSNLTGAIGSSSLDSMGVATIATTLVGGIHAITIAYAGDTNYTATTFDPFETTISPGTSILTVIPSSTPFYYPSASFDVGVTTLGSINPNGIVSLSSDVEGFIVNATLSGGVATLSSVYLIRASHVWSVFYEGDSNYQSLSTSLNLPINKATPQITLTNIDLSFPLGSFSVAVSSSPTGQIPNGYVSFYTTASTDLLKRTTLNADGTVNVTLALPVGASTVFATYEGNDNYTQINSAQVTIQMLKDTPSYSFTLTSGGTYPNAAFTATIIPTHNVAPPPTGDIILTSNISGSLGTGTLNNGQVVFSFNNLVVGVHELQGYYTGDVNFTNLVFTPFDQQILPAPVMILVTYDTPMFPVVNFTFQILPFTNVPTLPTGTLSLVSNVSGSIGTVTLDSNAKGGITAYVPAVSHEFTTSFRSTSGNYLSQVNVTNIIVQKAPVQITFQLLGNAIFPAATYSIQVTSALDTIPTGEVSLYSNISGLLGTATLINTQVQIQSDNYVGGIHSIWVVYGGDVNFTSTTSTTETLEVQTASTSVNISLSGTASIDLTEFLLIVTHSNIFPTGIIYLYNDFYGEVSSGTLVNGQATIQLTKFFGGVHNFYGVYLGDRNYSSCNSSILEQNIPRVIPQLSIKLHGTQATFPSATFEVNVTSSKNFAPTGTLTIIDTISGEIGRSTVDNSGTTLVQVNNLQAGSRVLYVNYSGDINYTSITNANFSQEVQKGVVLVTVNSPSTTVYLNTTVFISIETTFNSVPINGGVMNYIDGNSVESILTDQSNYTKLFTDLGVGIHSLEFLYVSENHIGSANLTVAIESVPSCTSLGCDPNHGACYNPATGYVLCQCQPPYFLKPKTSQCISSPPTCPPQYACASVTISPDFHNFTENNNDPVSIIVNEIVRISQVDPSQVTVQPIPTENGTILQITIAPYNTSTATNTTNHTIAPPQEALNQFLSHYNESSVFTQQFPVKNAVKISPESSPSKKFDVKLFLAIFFPLLFIILVIIGIVIWKYNENKKSSSNIVAEKIPPLEDAELASLQTTSSPQVAALQATSSPDMDTSQTPLSSSAHVESP